MKEGHMCRGKIFRPYPILLCSLCKPGQGSFDIVIEPKKKSSWKADKSGKLHPA